MGHKELAAYRNRIKGLRRMGATKSAAKLCKELDGKIDDFEYAAYAMFGINGTVEQVLNFLKEEAK